MHHLHTFCRPCIDHNLSWEAWDRTPDRSWYIVFSHPLYKKQQIFPNNDCPKYRSTNQVRSKAVELVEWHCVELWTIGAGDRDKGSVALEFHHVATDNKSSSQTCDRNSDSDSRALFQRPVMQSGWQALEAVTSGKRLLIHESPLDSSSVQNYFGNIRPSPPQQVCCLHA